jgi:predicted GNAT superfamily acetyltransferase
LAALRGDEVFGYSHMMAVNRDHQNKGVGARLKWEQRKRALAEGRDFIKWTWDPLQARNAHFNLNRLGVTVSAYAENFYGTDYPTEPERDAAGASGIDSDRLFAAWQLRSPRVINLAEGLDSAPLPKPSAKIEIPGDWTALVKHDGKAARQEQLRVRGEFQAAFSAGLICAGFERSKERPRYLLYEREAMVTSVG